MPSRLPKGIVQLEWCGTYSGPVRAALQALKYERTRALAAPLSAAMARRWLRAGVGGDLLTWVPVHPLRRRERGFDQAEELARAVAARLRLPVLGCLERSVRTEAQHALGRAERARNVGGAFRVAPAASRSVAGRWIVVIDDVVTTGSTLAGCAEALLASGALAVSALTVARDR